MNANANSHAARSRARNTARRSINEQLGILRALLRLLDPESPFQPILLSSIDIANWLACFGVAAQRLGESLRELPKTKRRDTALEACEPFLRLAYTLCQYADDHTVPPADSHLDGVPDIAAFSPETAICREDANAIANAMDTASKVLETSANQHQLLYRTLGLAAGRLKQKMKGPGGLLRLMKSRCRRSRPFRHKYAKFTDGLRAALANLPDPEVTLWETCRNRFATVRYQLEMDLLPKLQAIVKELCAPKLATAKKPEALKATTLRAVTAFLEAHGLARSLDAGPLTVQYHTLFRGLLAPVDAALRRLGKQKGLPPQMPRLIDDIRRLTPQLIKRDMLASWDTSLTETDPYTAEVVLAALHHLERPPEHISGSDAEARWIFGVSDADLAKWLRSGTYVGADPRAEISHSRAAETKRAARTLQYLRCVGAAFHDRRQWTPKDLRNARSTQHRLWTVNPLLAIHPRIAPRLENGRSRGRTGAASTLPGSRAQPTRRNRGSRPRPQR